MGGKVSDSLQYENLDLIELETGKVTLTHCILVLFWDPLYLLGNSNISLERIENEVPRGDKEFQKSQLCKEKYKEHKKWQKALMSQKSTKNFKVTNSVKVY